MVLAASHSTGTQPDDPSLGSRRWSAWFGYQPSHRSGPFARWPRTFDGILTAGVLIASVIAVSANNLDDGQEFSPSVIGEQAVAAYLLLAAMAASLLWRRRQPVRVVGFILVALIVWAMLGYGQGQDLALVFGIYSVGRYVTDLRYSLVVLAVTAVIIALGAVINDTTVDDVAGSLLFTWLPWYIGHRVRNRRDYLVLLQDRADRLERQRHDDARRAVADERSRIARELHDVVAHRVSMMTVQAGAAKTIARHDTDSAVEAMGDVARAGRPALGELRHLLGILRPDDDGPGGLGPQAGIGDVPTLAERLTQTGADVSLEIATVPDDLPATVDLSAYRIVQESVTNVIKHAGPNPSVEIRLGVVGQQLTIEVTNTTDTPRSAVLPRSGYGMAGMRERTEILGGTLEAGPRLDQRFSVVARIPIGPDSA